MEKQTDEKYENFAIFDKHHDVAQKRYEGTFPWSSNRNDINLMVLNAVKLKPRQPFNHFNYCHFVLCNFYIWHIIRIYHPPYGLRSHCTFPSIYGPQSSGLCGPFAEGLEPQIGLTASHPAPDR